MMPLSAPTTASATAVSETSTVTSVTESLPPPAPALTGATVAPAPAAPGDAEISSNLGNPNFVKAIYVDAIGPALKSPESIRKLVADVRDAGFNTIYAQVRAHGDAFYESQLVPRAKALPAGLDPLKLLLEEARKGDKPLKVHAMLVVFRAWGKPMGEMPAKHAAKDHPDWLTESQDGSKEVGEGKNEYWFDPAIPQVQDHLAAVAGELAKNYDIDGIQLDRVRYPDAFISGYNPTAVERFNADKNKTGKPQPRDPDWSAWRREQVTATVKKMRDSIKAARPTADFSAGALTFGGGPSDYENYQSKSTPVIAHFTDVFGWAKEGLIDTIVLMNYKAADRNAEDFEKWNRFAIENKANAKLVVAVGGWLNPPKYTLAMMLPPIMNSRADGVALYSYHQPAKAPATQDQAFAAVKQVFDPQLIASKTKEIAAVVSTAGGDPVKRLDQLSMHITGVAPEPSATPAPALTATPAVVALATPEPTRAPAAAPSAAAANLPSLGAGTAAGTNLPSLATATSPDLPSLSAAGGTNSNLPSLSAAAASASPTPGLPSLAQASTARDLPSLSQAAVPGETTNLPSLGAATGSDNKPGDNSLPSLSAATENPPKPVTGELPSLSAASTDSGALPPLQSLQEAPNKATDLAPADTANLPSLSSVTAEGEQSRTERTQTAAKKPLSSQETETVRTEETVVSRAEARPDIAAQPLAPGRSPFEPSAADGIATAKQDVSSITKGPSISIPDYGPQTNYTGQRITGGEPAVATITPPTVLTPIPGTGPTGTVTEIAAPDVALPAAGPTAAPDYSEVNSFIGTPTPVPGLRYYAPKAARRSTTIAAAASGPPELIVLTSGKEFTGRVLERGSLWRIQLLDGSIITLPASKVARVVSTTTTEITVTQ